MNRDILNNLSLFLAHSLTLEQESAQRLREFADTMSHHHQPALARLFLELAEYSDLHAQEVQAICSAHQLPELKPWEYHWPAEEPPETCDYGRARYDMQPRQALRLMLEQEMNAEKFYADIAEHANDSEVARFATEFAEEERQHAHMLEQRLTRLEATSDRVEPLPDIDPPHQPDA